MEELQKEEHTQLNTLQVFEFDEMPVVAGIVHMVEMIAIKPIVENLGLNWSGVHQKIKRDEKLNQLCVQAKVFAADGKQREMICLSPANFQNWLWSLSPTDNMNFKLWEDYKKGLVIYLLEMLKVSLDEIKRLRGLEEQYLSLKTMVTKYINANEQGKSYSKLAKESWKESNVLQKGIIDRLDVKDVAQLNIFG